MVLKVDPGVIEDINLLIETGDLSLSERRSVFKKKMNRECRLSDAELVVAIAATDDDDDSAFIDNCLEQEKSILG